MQKMMYVISLLVLLLLHCADATILYVTPDGSSQSCTTTAPCSLFDGVRLAVSGDTVQLAPGDYSVAGRNSVGSGVTVDGQGASLTCTGTDYSAFLLNGNAVLSNLQINECTTGVEVLGAENTIQSVGISVNIPTELTVGVLLEASAFNTLISGCSISGAQHNIEADDGSLNTTIRGCVVNVINGARYIGVYVPGPNATVVVESSIFRTPESNQASSFTASDDTTLSIYSSTISGIGISVQSGGNLYIEGSDISGSTARGCILATGPSVQIYDSTIHNCHGTSAGGGTAGVLVSTSTLDMANVLFQNCTSPINAALEIFSP